jgi:RNA polymerase sigma-70 factor (ECF subfamily)
VAENRGTLVEARCGDGPSDGLLLERFVAGGDERAFEALLRRHGPMVLGVCRRILGDAHDAEDAFQATFLVLARRASAVVPREAVGGWLHGVAQRTASKARGAAARRRVREVPLADVPHPAAPPERGCPDLAALLDRELSRLPERYRLPVVLCDLEGRTRREVARQLSLPDGTLSNRLSKGRELLRHRLSGCGFAVPAATLAALLTPQAAPAAPATLAQALASAGACSPEVIALSEGVLRDMMLPKLKIATAVLTLAAVAAAAGVMWQARAERPDERKKAQADPEPKRDVEKAAKEDLKKLEGTWYAVGGAYLGKANPEKDLKTVMKGNQWQKLVITGDRFAWGSAIKDPFRTGTVNLDPTKTPRQMDLIYEEDGKTLTHRCIYEVDKADGDRFTLCLDRPDRPKKFETTAGAKNRMLYVWRRQSR